MKSTAGSRKANLFRAASLRLRRALAVTFAPHMGSSIARDRAASACLAGCTSTPPTFWPWAICESTATRVRPVSSPYPLPTRAEATSNQL